MADPATNAAPVTRAKSIKSKIVPGKDLGNPKAVTLLPDNVRRLTMGVVMGFVDKIITRTMPTGEVYEGLSGYFRAIPDNAHNPIVESGVCYLPSGFFELIANPFREAEAKAKTDGTPAPRLNFRFKVEAVKDGNPQGYSWQYTPELAAIEADPLAHLTAGAPQLTHQPQTPAPTENKTPEPATVKRK